MEKKMLNTLILARKNDTVVLDDMDGTTFTVTRVARIEDEYGDKVHAIYGTNDDGTEHGPYFETEYAVLVD